MRYGLQLLHAWTSTGECILAKDPCFHFQMFLTHFHAYVDPYIGVACKGTL
ncbi:hypothetical protein LINPERPRIM_LOCUS30363 [Linum perenne]